MSEIKEKYQTKTAVEVTEYKCEGCENVYGIETPEGYLETAEMIVQMERGWCKNCGKEIRWFSNDYRLKRMLDKRRKS